MRRDIDQHIPVRSARNNSNYNNNYNILLFVLIILCNCRDEGNPGGDGVRQVRSGRERLLRTQTHRLEELRSKGISLQLEMQTC